MTLSLELGGIRDPAVVRAFQILAMQFPIVVPSSGGGGGAPSGPAGGVLSGAYPNPSFAADMATQAELDAHTTLTTTAHGGIVASTDPRLTDARTPSGVIAGDLAGSTWPTLNIAAGAIVNADINAAAAIAKSKLAALAIVNADVDAAAAIAESKLNLATDAAAGIGSRRTLGPGALQAAPGNDARLSDARTPTAHQSTHQSGNADALTGDLDATARSNVSKAGTLVGTRRGLNLIQGTNVTLTMTDDAPNERVNVTIDAAAGGGGTADTFVTRAKWMTD